MNGSGVDVTPDRTSGTPSQRARRPHGGVPWPRARQLAAAAPAALPPTRVPLDAALGRPLAGDLVALTDLPVADVSAMDGWAVAGDPPWRIVGESAASAPLLRGLVDGECARIATGAVVPPGADAVLPVEWSSHSDDGVRAHPDRPARRHIRPRGDEAHRGDVLLPAGTLVTPPVLGLAASVGHDELLVAPSASVEVLVLGDELVFAGLPGPGRTRDALGLQLPGWLSAYGAQPPTVTRLADRLPDLVAVLRESTSQLLVTTGGTSVGERDLVRAAISEAGGRVVVDGVQVKPGHPMVLAGLPGDRWLAGLPGNPLAACVALETLVAPLLETLHGHRRPLQRRPLAAAALRRPGDVHRLLPVRLDDAGHAAELPACGSAMLRGLAQATGLAVVPPEGAAAGDLVEYLPLPWTG